MKTQTSTTYQDYQFSAKGNLYSVVIASGASNYVCVAKLTNNPYRTAGKVFTDFDKAQESYKCPAIKTELLKIELGLN